MVLQFKFKYLSKNKTLGRFLDFVAKKYDCEYKILQDLNNVYFFIKGSEKVIEEFSNALSNYLPMSIFYHSLDIEVIDKLPSFDSISLKEDNLISFCPKCLKKIENEKSKYYYDVFIPCQICDKFEEGSYFIKDNIKVKSSKELFEDLAKLILEDKKIKIKTLSGTFVFSKVQNIDFCKNLLVTNLKNISKVVVINKEEIISLACIEKPSIDFKINEVYKQKNDIKKSTINIRMSNDLTLYLLSLELQKYEIDFLNIEKENVEFDSFLDVYEKYPKKRLLDIPKIKCINEQKIFVKSNSYPKKLDEAYSKFNENNKSHFMTVLAENELFEKSIVNFYISSKDNDGLSFYSIKLNGLINIVKELYIPKNIDEIFKEIKKDEVGKKLIDNYKIKYKSEYENAINTKIENDEKRSFYTYWKFIKIILNFKNDVVVNAENIFLEKGPRLDYKVIDDDKTYNREFDYVKLFKSAISFKLAGVEEEVISLGLVESLCYFIGNEIDKINSTEHLDGISLCGDMFKYDIFNTFIDKSITKNFSKYYNREFVIQK